MSEAKGEIACACAGGPVTSQPVVRPRNKAKAPAKNVARLPNDASRRCAANPAIIASSISSRPAGTGKLASCRRDESSSATSNLRVACVVYASDAPAPQKKWICPQRSDCRARPPDGFAARGRRVSAGAAIRFSASERPTLGRQPLLSHAGYEWQLL